MARHLEKCRVFNSLTSTDLISEGYPLVDLESILKKNKKISARSLTSESRYWKLFSGGDACKQDIEFLNMNLSETENLRDIARELLPLSSNRVREFQSYLLESMAEKNVPFTFVESESFQKSLVKLNPFAINVLPTSQSMKKLLANNLDQHREKMLANLRFAAESYPPPAVTLAIDTWQCVSNQSIMGLVVSCSGVSYVSSETMELGSETGVKVAIFVERFLESFEHELGGKHYISNFVADDASSNAKARKLLGLRHPHVIFQRCFAHQVNLICKDLLNVVGYDDVSRLRTFIKRVKKSKPFRAGFLKKCRELYGEQPFTLQQIAKTRWNSVHFALCSVLRVRTALLKFSSRTKDFKDLDRFFIQRCLRLERTVRVLTKASLAMQKEEQNLACALECLFKIFYSFNKTQNLRERHSLLEALETRWTKYEQPLFITAYSLHAKFYLGFMTMLNSLTRSKQLTARDMVTFVELYSKKHIPNSNEVEVRRESSKLFSRRLGLPIKELEEQDVCFSLVLVKAGAESLSKLSRFLSTATCQSASCERLFSSLGNIKTKVRNRLSNEKMRDLSQLKHVIQKESTKSRVRRVLSSKEYSKVQDCGVSSSVSSLSVTEADQSETESGVRSEEEEQNISGTDVFEEDEIEVEVLQERWNEAFGSEKDDTCDDSEVESEVNDVWDREKFFGKSFRSSHGPITSNSPEERIKGPRAFKIELKSLFLAWAEMKSLRVHSLSVSSNLQVSTHPSQPLRRSRRTNLSRE